jgi:hypothetical protein
MTYGRARLIATALLAVTAAACTSANAPGSSPTVNVPQASATAAPASPPATPAGNTSERGNIIKKQGETAGFGPGQDDIEVTFVVDKITVDAKCTSQFAQKPEHGHFVKVDLRAETKPTMPTDRGYSIGAYDFSTVGGDGVTEQSLGTGPAFGCIDPSEQFPPNITPGSKYRGSIVLDTKNPAGVLVYRPGFMASGGWEWHYGK